MSEIRLFVVSSVGGVMPSRVWLPAVCLVGACTSGGVGARGRTCGVDSGSTFRVEVLEAFVFPYKPETEALWDWDGNVPDWLLDLTDTLADISGSPEIRTAAEILDLVDQVAPLALEGTTPPDPILQVVSALTEATTTSTSTLFGGTTYTYTYDSYAFGTVDAMDDTYEPRFRRGIDVGLYPDEDLWLDVYDEDLAQDDYVGSVSFGLRDLRGIAGCGPTTMRGSEDSGLYSVTVLVERW